MADFSTSDLPLRPGTRRAGLREMEGRVDENNRSLPPNPFVSMVLIQPSIPNPPLHRSSSLNRCSCTVQYTRHSQLTNSADLQKHTVISPDNQDNQQQHPLNNNNTKIQLRLNSVLAFTPLSLFGFFLECKHIPLLRQTLPVCISFPFFVYVS